MSRNGLKIFAGILILIVQYQVKDQHVNIRAVIKLYEDGKIDGSERVYVMQGKVVTRGEMHKGTAWAWAEVGILNQFARKFAYGHGPFGLDHHE